MSLLFRCVLVFEGRTARSPTSTRSRVGFARCKPRCPDWREMPPKSCGGGRWVHGVGAVRGEGGGHSRVVTKSHQASSPGQRRPSKFLLVRRCCRGTLPACPRQGLGLGFCHTRNLNRVVFQCNFCPGLADAGEMPISPRALEAASSHQVVGAIPVATPTAWSERR